MKQMLPTMVGVAGIDSEAVRADGLNLIPHLLEGSGLLERMLFWRARSQSAVRSGPWKLVRDGKETELYRLDDDPGEQHDLASVHADVVAQLVNAWNRWEADVNRSAKVFDAKRD